MRYLSVCSGIEAASVAWHHLGWEPVGFSEIEPFPAAVLAHRFPHVPNYGDMTKFEEWPIEPGTVDFLVGGTPCQSFSVAGLRKGLEDPRGNLMLTYLAIAARLKPRWIVWENVPGVLSSNGGRDFGTFLGALGELGYGFAYRVLDAQYVRVGGWPRAVPQRRRRVFVVGCLGDWTAAAEVLAVREGLQRHLEAGGKTRKGAASDAEGGARVGCWWDGGQVSQTLDAVLSKGQTMPEKNRFPAVLQPTAGTLGNRGLRSHTELDGHGAYIPVPYTKSKRAQSVTDDETWVDGQVNPTLSLFDQGDTRATTVAVAFANRTRDGVKVPEVMADGVSPALTNPGNGGRSDAINVAIGLTTYETPKFAQIIAPSLTATNDPSRSPQSSEVTQQVAAVHASTMTVRRLSARECERLQGFPDDWTLIPWRKKPAEECPDGPRYKALGNSMACNCMAWIGERIAKWEADHA
jgi:DNA (cytosine-5)-methyltransferase 1